MEASRCTVARRCSICSTVHQVFTVSRAKSECQLFSFLHTEDDGDNVMSLSPTTSECGEGSGFRVFAFGLYPKP